MADLYTLARRARAEIIRTDTAAAERLMRIYGDVYRRLSAEADAIAARIEAARQRGERISAAQLYQEGRLQRLRAQALDELQRAQDRAVPAVNGAIDIARAQGAGSARAMAEGVLPPGFSATLPSTTILQAATLSMPGSPVAALFATIAPQGAEAIVQAIVGGIAAGSHPTVVARGIRTALGGNAVRALTISRTEIMRAHREAARETYQRSSNVIRGWVWVAGLGARTCASCWAQNGTVHPLDEQMATHPRCRCVAAPQTVSWAELGVSLPEPAPVPYGPDLFATQPAALQRQVLGDSKYEAYRRGQVHLEDFVARRHSPEWGASTSEASLVEARRNAAVPRAA